TLDLVPIAVAWRLAPKKVSLCEWVHSNDTLILPRSYLAQSIVTRLNRVLFQRLTQLLLDEKPAGRTLVVLDELRQLVPLEGLDNLLIEGRDRDICVVAGAQDSEGLE